jgi:ribosomal protein S18 acetylase RimI-like enzyme
MMPDEIVFEYADPLVGTPDAFLLDHPVWTSLAGPHSHLAESKGQTSRYPIDVSPFVGTRPGGDGQVWNDLAALVGAGGVVPLAGAGLAPPAGWEVAMRIVGVQMVDVALQAEEDAEAVRLRPDDVADMLALVGRTKPGPFLARTIEMGNYLGIRRDGILVAMAGERLHPPGWTEISAVCTDDAYRGQGLATRLVRAVVGGIRSRQERAFLHATASNVNAIRLYQAIGFALRREVVFQAVRVPR